MKYIKLKSSTIGFISGIISGLFSSGGGLILIPLYSFLFKSSEKETKSTTIFCILPMVFVSSMIYGINNYIDWNITLIVAFGGIIGGFIGSKILNKLHPIIFRIIFIIFLLYSIIRILGVAPMAEVFSQKRTSPMVEIILGMIAGICTGVGIGGGAILVPLLDIFLGLNQRLSQGINLICFIPSAFVSIIYNLKHKNINIKNSLFIIAFGSVGSLIGAYISKITDINNLKFYFGIFLLLIFTFEVFNLYKYIIENKKINKRNTINNK